MQLLQQRLFKLLQSRGPLLIIVISHSGKTHTAQFTNAVIVLLYDKLSVTCQMLLSVHMNITVL